MPFIDGDTHPSNWILDSTQLNTPKGGHEGCIKSWAHLKQWWYLSNAMRYYIWIADIFRTAIGSLELLPSFGLVWKREVIFFQSPWTRSDVKPWVSAIFKKSMEDLEASCNFYMSFVYAVGTDDLWKAIDRLLREYGLRWVLPFFLQFLRVQSRYIWHIRVDFSGHNRKKLHDLSRAKRSLVDHIFFAFEAWSWLWLETCLFFRRSEINPGKLERLCHTAWRKPWLHASIADGLSEKVRAQKKILTHKIEVIR